MGVRVRFAPSPTGFLHIGGVRTALFNWLYARHEGGEFLLRVENTDHTREVEESVAQIQDSLTWLGLDWDGEVTFQLDRLERHQEVARRLVEEGHAYEDDGAIRFRMPDEGTTGWEDIVRGRIDFPNEKLEDVVLLRGDGRPTYNFASPVDDLDDGITHVVRGEDHIANTPKQIRILEALGATLPRYAHVPNVLGEDGKKLSKRHGAVSVEEFRSPGYLPEAIVNYLALLGWSLDAETTIIHPDELVERLRHRAHRQQRGHVRLREARVDERRVSPGACAGRVRRPARRLPARDRLRRGRGAHPRGRAARAGEDLGARPVPRVRRLPLRAGRAGSGRARGRRADPPGGRRGARAGRAVHGRADRGGTARIRRAARAEAAQGVRPAARWRSPARRSRRASSSRWSFWARTRRSTALSAAAARL